MAATLDVHTSIAISNATSISQAVVLGAPATVLLVEAPYWSTSATIGQITGITYGGVALTNIGKATRSNGADGAEIWFLAGPATGSNTLVASLQSAANGGRLDVISFSGTPTSGGSGTVWADFTSTSTSVNAANSSVSVPNNTSNDAIIDCVSVGSGVAPTMVAQTNRTQNHSSADNGEGSGGSYLLPAPSGAQTMNWTIASTSTAQAAVRVLGTTGAFDPTTTPPLMQSMTTPTGQQIGQY